MLEHFVDYQICPRPESVSGIAPQLILISLTFLLLQMVMKRFWEQVKIKSENKNYTGAITRVKNDVFIET